MDIDLNGFRETFFQEAAEHTADMEAALLEMVAGSVASETLHAIFRCAHSMKAGAGMFGFELIQRFTHELESLLDGMRDGKIEPTSNRIELLLRAVDVLKELLEAAARGETGLAPAGMEAILHQLTQARPGESTQNVAPSAPPEKQSAASAAVEYTVRFAPSPQLFQLGLDPFLVLRELAEMGRVLEVSADLSRLPPLKLINPETCYLAWRIRLLTQVALPQIRDVFAFVEDVATVSIEASQPTEGPQLSEAKQSAETLSSGSEAQTDIPASKRPSPAPGRSRASGRESSIRVSIGKVDRLIDLVGELVIAQSMATQVIQDFSPDKLTRLQEAVADMELYTRELQERVMRIRMLPVGTIFSRFPRLVHDTAAALHKQVILEISGEETELDKGVVEQIADPLTHLVRNSVDHGIELPDERLRNAKSATGTIRLNAYHQGGNVIVEVTDDGRGLDVERIRQKGRERGLIRPDEELSDEQACALIFQPGFSTAAAVSDLSGRGVGMDVVRRSVDALNGAVAFVNHPGRGTSFRIKLPLTLAVLDGLLLQVGDQTFVLPLASIVESIQPRPGQVQNVAGRGEVVVVRKHPLRLLRLHRLFDVPGAETDPSRGLVVIVEHEGRHLALLVDQLLGQQQVVIKSLETNYRKVDGITGATILGDGRAALILDVTGIVQMGKGVEGNPDGKGAGVASPMELHAV